MSRLLRSSVLWESLFENLPAGVGVLLPLFDADGSLEDFEILSANPQLLRISGRPEPELLGSRLGDLHPVFRQRTVLGRYGRILERGAAEEFEQLVPADVDSTTVPGWYAVTAIPADGRLIVMLSSIDKRKSVLVEAVRMMNVDDLTGIGNRRLLKSHFWRHRQTNTGMALIYLDLNGFKGINDTHGHETGDEVLRIIAQRFRNSLRPGEAVARLGGDEFAVLLDTGDRAAAVSVAERLRDAVARPISVGANTMEVSTSLGMAYFPEDGRSFEALSAVADGRMYSDKAGQQDGARQPAQQGSAPDADGWSGDVAPVEKPVAE